MAWAASSYLRWLISELLSCASIQDQNMQEARIAYTHSLDKYLEFNYGHGFTAKPRVNVYGQSKWNEFQEFLLNTGENYFHTWDGQEFQTTHYIDVVLEWLTNELGIHFPNTERGKD